MKFKPRDPNLIAQPIKQTQPTIWALRKNVRAGGQDNAAAEDEIATGSLYEHLFGYDPIRVLGRSVPLKADDVFTTAENPSLHIINSQTNFAVMEIAADLPPEKI